jgi:hypothetical protein
MGRAFKIILLQFAVICLLILAEDVVTPQIINVYLSVPILILIQYIVLLWLCCRFLGWNGRQTIWGAVSGLVIGVPLLYCISNCNYLVEYFFKILPDNLTMDTWLIWAMVIIFLILPLDLLGVGMYHVVGRFCKK